jgi:N-acetylmuramoyl-L-alanine amidase
MLEKKMKRGQFPPFAITALLLVTLGLAPVLADMPTNSSSGSSSGRTVFIDPGHGGEDSGARGPGGTLEKDVSLRIARLVLDRLTGKYRLNSSRTDDKQIDIFDRSGFANASRADLFFSFHVGGSFCNSASGFSLYYYERPVTPNDGTPLSAENSTAPSSDREQWRAVQLKHFSASRQLARFIRNRIGQFSDEAPQVTGAESLVLAGADMPAILIEIGCLGTPSDEKKLGDITYLSRIADAISIGIMDYLGDNSGISSMDLHR